MSGHSKWANIKNRKGLVDKKKSETFTKLARGIITAIRQGGGVEVISNHQLKVAIEKARVANMPKENIDRLLATYVERQKNLVGMTLEGYAGAGVPLIIELETDNKNRSLSEIKLIIKTHGGSLGEEGSVGYLFDRLIEVEVARELSLDEQLGLIDLGVTEIDTNLVYLPKEKLVDLKQMMGIFGVEISSIVPVRKVKSPIPIRDEATAQEIALLVEKLEEQQDVVAVYLGGEYVEEA
jgi:YebC/PmpR family DNA-binding regulatory protein